MRYDPAFSFAMIQLFFLTGCPKLVPRAAFSMSLTNFSV
jgi:hypothetical protein